MSEALKPVLATLAKGRTLTRGEAEAAFDILFAGEATSAQMGAFLFALRVRGETLDEITGRRRGDARAHAAGERPGRRDRHRRHRRRRSRDLQCLDADGDDRRGLWRAGGQARQPRRVVPLWFQRRADRARRCRRARPGGGRALPARGRARLHVGAGAPRRDAPFRVRPCRPRHADDLQPARPAVEPGRRHAPACRRLRAGLAGAPSPVRSARSAPRRRGWCTAATASTRSPPRARPRSWPGKPVAIRRFTINPEDVGLARVTLAELKGGDARHNAAALTAVLGGAPGPYRDIACLNAAAALVVAGRVADLRDGLARARGALDSGAAKGVLDRLVTASQTTLVSAG